MYCATRRLAAQINDCNNHTNKPNTELHVIPNTRHQNFCDVVFWLPKWALHRMGKFFALGSADAFEAYEGILNRTFQFLKNF